MGLILLLLWQLLSYGFLWWLVFIAIAFAAAYTFKVPGILLGHMVLAFIISMLDGQWIQSAMNEPGWNGQPDQDGVFIVGVVIRIVLINTILLLVSWMGVRLRGRHRVR